MSLQNGTALLQKGARWAMGSCLKELDQTLHFLQTGERRHSYGTTEREIIIDS